MKILDEKIKNNSLSHAILLCGEYGNYDTKIAMSFVCEAETKPCFQCRQCLNYEFSADISLTDLEDKQITVDIIRDIIKESSVYPLEAKNKVFIIRNVENMNVNASNALLKTLEEPPVFTKFVLTSKNPNKLLDTILSRCLIFTFNSDKEALENEIAIKIVNAICDKNELGILSLKITSKPEFKEILVALKFILRDALLDTGSKESRKLKEYIGDRKILEIYKNICVLEEKLEFNININNLLCFFVTNIF